MKKHIPKIIVFLLLIFLAFVITPAGRGMILHIVELPFSFRPPGAQKETSPKTSAEETQAVQELTEQIKQKNKEQEQEFPLIQVIDDGAELPANQGYTGLVCNIKDTSSEVRLIRQLDGSFREEEVFTARLNNVLFSVPEGGTRDFGVPIFSTENYSDEEKTARKQWHDVVGGDSSDFNQGIDVARQMIMDGYFQKPLEKFLMHYPELNPAKREYVLHLMGGGRTDRASDNTSWWDLDYRLETTAENGELIPMAYIDVTRVFLAQGSPVTYDDTHYRIWSAESAYWHLLEDPSQDLGKTWISQLPDEDFSTEEKILSYVEKKGGNFEYLLPPGADKDVDFTFHKEESIWYDYLVWSGATDTYDITLAIPLMEEGAGGWYLASRIKKQAANKEICRHTLSTMMQTFHAAPYVHVVKEGESLWSIYDKYITEAPYLYPFTYFIDYNFQNNPNLIYPGQIVRFPWSTS